MLVCNQWQTAFRNSETNSGPLSDTIEAGSPWSFHTSHTKSMARSCALMLVLQGVKCLVLRQPVDYDHDCVESAGSGLKRAMMSTDRSVHLCSGMGEASVFPGTAVGRTVSVTVRPHVTQKCDATRSAVQSGLR